MFRDGINEERRIAMGEAFEDRGNVHGLKAWRLGGLEAWRLGGLESGG